MVTFWPILLVIEARYFVEECKKKIMVVFTNDVGDRFFNKVSMNAKNKL
jgi:hypothetical protein